ncbi:MAG: ABC transporter ATP-binding protein [Mycoplasmataceae bacterium]|nr:ABC transporter ATP-binding protein [Mycoplasmataceae bacterium]
MKEEKKKKENKENNLKLIKIENKEKKRKSKITQNIGKEKIKEEKNSFKKKINSESNIEKKKKLKNEFKRKFKGIESNSKGNIVDIKGLNKYFCNGSNCEHILHNIDLKIPRGKVVVILGASGSGKSTLLNIISGLTPPSSGDVIVNNNNLFYMNDSSRTKFRKLNISFVFQSYNLIPSLTVIENIKVGENLRSKNVEEIKMVDILKTLDLTVQSKKYPFQLSGGQNQRVSIGRALAKNPNILFADEPTGALDEKKGKEALQMLLDINKKFNTTLIMVTHNPNFQKVSDIVLHIKDGTISNIINNKTKKTAKDIEWS